MIQNLLFSEKFDIQVTQKNSIFHSIKTAEMEHHTDKDYHQSLKSKIGKKLEKEVYACVKPYANALGHEIIDGNKLEKRKYLSKQLNYLKNTLTIDGIFPDADLIVYDPFTSEIKCIYSCKKSVRDRIMQTVGWKLLLNKKEETRSIKMFLITMEKLFLKNGRLSKAGQTASSCLDATYVLSNTFVCETPKIRQFNCLFDDLKTLLKP